jgi:hypothetical protein
MISEPARMFAFFLRFGKPSSDREQIRPALILRTSFGLRWRPSELLPSAGAS